MSNSSEDSSEKSAFIEDSCSVESTLQLSDGNDSTIPGAVLVGSLIITQALKNFERVGYTFMFFCKLLITL